MWKHLTYLNTVFFFPCLGWNLQFCQRFPQSTNPAPKHLPVCEGCSLEGCGCSGWAVRFCSVQRRTAALGEDAIYLDILGGEFSRDKVQPLAGFLKDFLKMCCACMSLKSRCLSVSFSTIIPLTKCQFSFLKCAWSKKTPQNNKMGLVMEL